MYIYIHIYIYIYIYILYIYIYIYIYIYQVFLPQVYTVRKFLPPFLYIHTFASTSRRSKCTGIVVD